MGNCKRLLILFFFYSMIDTPWKIISKYYIDFLIFIIPSIHIHLQSLQYANFDKLWILSIKTSMFVFFKPYHTFRKYTSYFSDSHMQPFEMSRDWGTPHYCFHTLAYYPHCHQSHSNTEDTRTPKFVHYLMEYIYHKKGMSYSGRGLSYPQDKHSTP